MASREFVGRDHSGKDHFAANARSRTRNRAVRTGGAGAAKKSAATASTSASGSTARFATHEERGSIPSARAGCAVWLPRFGHAPPAVDSAATISGMSPAENKLLVSRYIEEVVNTGDVERIDRFLAPDYAEIHDGQRHPLGLDGAREHVRGVRATYPDLHLAIERQIAEGDWVATCYVARGTHRGKWLGIEPTGRPLTFTGVNVDRIANGRIVEHGGAANLFGPLLAAGAVQIGG